MYIALNNHVSPTVVTIDNFLADPDAVRAFALEQTFEANLDYFRGKRTITSFRTPLIREAIEKALGQPITNWEHPVNGVFQICVGGDQLVYHSDDNTHAAVLYLTPDAPVQAGTTIYQSKTLKSRTVAEAIGKTERFFDRNTFTISVEAAASEMYDGKLLDRTAWEPVDVMGNVYNRLTIWDARMVHAASEYFGHDLQTGRLFMMFFFDC